MGILNFFCDKNEERNEKKENLLESKNIENQQEVFENSISSTRKENENIQEDENMKLKVVSPTQHAIMRYMSRYNKELIFTDAAFKQWKQNHLEEYEKSVREITILSENPDFVITGAYNTKDTGIYEYRINIKEALILVCQKDKIRTCYNITMGNEFDVNTSLALTVTMINRRKELEFLEEKLKKEKEEIFRRCDTEISIINEEIEIMKEKLRKLESTKEQYKLEKVKIESELKEIELHKNKIEKKIISPLYSFNNSLLGE